MIAYAIHYFSEYEYDMDIEIVLLPDCGGWRHLQGNTCVEGKKASRKLKSPRTCMTVKKVYLLCSQRIGREYAFVLHIHPSPSILSSHLSLTLSAFLITK